eukprot:maker-scaffold_6-snap-gene-11.67-mRNA-1 protein AED:0.01 eAED:0.01 QI:138/1/1/1/1/1/2/78/161
MVRLIKSGRVVIVTRGRFAGCKAVVVQTSENGTSSHKFAHALVVGISKPAKKITKKMDEKTQKKKAQLSIFVKVLNYNHLIPSRYQVDFDLKKIKVQLGDKDNKKTEEVAIDTANIAKPEVRKQIRKALKEKLEAEFFKQGERKTSKAAEGVQFFYKKLRF